MDAPTYSPKAAIRSGFCDSSHQISNAVPVFPEKYSPEAGGCQAHVSFAEPVVRELLEGYFFGFQAFSHSEVALLQFGKADSYSVNCFIFSMVAVVANLRLVADFLLLGTLLLAVFGLAKGWVKSCVWYDIWYMGYKEK